MNKRQRAVYELLKKKPKVKAFGFNQKELKGLAAKIAENLDSAEDASDEDVNAEIETQIEAVLPLLEFGQSFANRVINDSRNETEDNNDGDGDNDDDGSAEKPKPNRSPNQKKPKSDEEPAWFKAYREKMEKQIADIKGERVTDTRKARLEKLLKDTGTFGTRTMKAFRRMKFETDEDFDEFYSEVEEDLKSENQERANKGLEKLGAPATGGSSKKDNNKPEVLSEDEIKEIAKM